MFLALYFSIVSEGKTEQLEAGCFSLLSITQKYSSDAQSLLLGDHTDRKALTPEIPFAQLHPRRYFPTYTLYIQQKEWKRWSANQIAAETFAERQVWRACPNDSNDRIEEDSVQEVNRS